MRLRGVGLSSDALTRFSEEEAVDHSPRRVLLPDWGLFMSFAMITEGRVAYVADDNPAWLRRTLCEGLDAEAALIAPNPTDRIDTWTRVAGLAPPAIRRYAQRGGALILTVARWPAAPDDPACSPAPAPG